MKKNKIKYFPSPASPLLFFQCASDCEIAFALSYGFTLVGVTFALTVGEFDLDESVFEIEFQWNKCAALEFQILGKFEYFALVHQQSAVAVDFVIEFSAVLAN